MKNQPRQPGFIAIVLAGDRDPNDPLTLETGAACKAFVEIEGEPMVLRVLNTLATSPNIEQRILSGPQQRWMQNQSCIKQLISSGQIRWLQPEATPSISAYHAMKTVDNSQPVLITTADHPLLSTEIVNKFCTDSYARNLDVAVGVCEYELIKEAFPGIRKTVMKFKDGSYCGCNLFAFMTSQARYLADSWRQVESERKNPLRIIKLLGLLSVVQYATGTLTMKTALDRLSNKLGLRIGAVMLPFPEAAVDVDSVADRLIVQNKLSE